MQDSCDIGRRIDVIRELSGIDFAAAISLGKRVHTSSKRDKSLRFSPMAQLAKNRLSRFSCQLNAVRMRTFWLVIPKGFRLSHPLTDMLAYDIADSLSAGFLSRL